MRQGRSPLCERGRQALAVVTLDCRAPDCPHGRARRAPTTASPLWGQGRRRATAGSSHFNDLEVVGGWWVRDGYVRTQPKCLLVRHLQRQAEAKPHPFFLYAQRVYRVGHAFDTLWRGKLAHSLSSSHIRVRMHMRARPLPNPYQGLLELGWGRFGKKSR
jgi:hypothetical protein